MRITVFTPAYNRGYIIENLYNSLKKQSFKDFEWLVIDDGSADNTEELFAGGIKEDNFFEINYIKVENGGKHRAINKGVGLAKGELFFIVDSDDSLPENSLELIDKTERSIPADDKAEFCGVCGLKGSNNKLIGTTFVGDGYLDITALERAKNGITGDKSEVFYTSVLKKYPFPEFENEKFVTEALVWDRMAHDGLKMRFFNAVTYNCDYLDDGLTKAGLKLYADNPRGWGAYISQSIEFGKVSGIEIWNEYLRFFYNTREKMHFSQIANCLNRNPAKLWIQLLGVRIFYKLYKIE